MASSSSTPPKKYDVFLSFSGKDTRTNFVSHLYDALVLREIKTYMDEHNLNKGESISHELPAAIQESTFAIIVFSNNYASSTWCLDELMKIMECNSKRTQTVIPVFYNIDPSDIRNQTNSFAESFVKHELRFKDNMEKVQIWRRNLREAADLVGYDLSQRNITEASCIYQIVLRIFNTLHGRTPAEGLVGIEDRVKKLRSILLGSAPDAVCFARICGMGGVGKTTIARVIYDDLIDRFDGGCFLRDVHKRDTVALQKILLSRVLKLKLGDVNICDEYQGSSKIRHHLWSKKVLLVLDDVNDRKQLKALVGERKWSWFKSGSKIIITTRDQRLLNDADVTYEVESLSKTEATELFCWNAFKMSHPPENFVNLSDRAVNSAHGLPLALEVLGSHLHGLEMDVWESVLASLQDAPQEEVFSMLKISFEGLDDRQRDIFLDIACFFRGNRKDEVKRKLNSFGFHPVHNIAILHQKSLIRVLLDGNIEMHDLIQEMGWEIVCREAKREPRRYSRLWKHDNIINVLMNNKGTSHIEGLVLKEEGRFTLSKRAFENMNKLRLLEFYNHNFRGAPDYLPNSLRWLQWDNYPAKSLPETFKPTNLVSLELRDSLIVQTPDISAMLYLEVLDVSRCRKLLKVHPSVGVHKKLVHLNLSGCFVLKKFPKIIQMDSLEILNLHGCSKLEGFPEFHSNTSHLRILNLQDTKIRRLPWSLGYLTGLEEINLYGCKNLTSLPSCLCSFKDLKSIALSGCSKLEYFSENPDDEVVNCFDDSQPSSLKRKRVADYGASNMLSAFLSLFSLRKLHMRNCNVLELIIPESIGCLTSLQELDLGGNDFISLPKSINRFSCLEVFHLNSCRNLKALPELPSSIRGLDLDYCTTLTRIPNLVDLLGKYKDLHHLSLMDCVQLVQKHEQETSDSPQTQTNAVAQCIPQFMSAFWDLQSVSKVLCTRKEVLLVYLPKAELPDWLHQIIPEPQMIGSPDTDEFSEVQDIDDFPEDEEIVSPIVTVTLCPSWCNDKLQGFALCAVSKAFDLEVVTDDGRVINIPIITAISHIGLEQTAFLYIPISKIRSDTKLKEQKECILFEVINKTGPWTVQIDTRWGVRLVYEGEVDMDITNFTYTNHPASASGAKLKVSVETRQHLGTHRRERMSDRVLTRRI